MVFFLSKQLKLLAQYPCLVELNIFFISINIQIFYFSSLKKYLQVLVFKSFQSSRFIFIFKSTHKYQLNFFYLESCLEYYKNLSKNRNFNKTLIKLVTKKKN